ncbi:MAG TPA: hypothetical protein ENK56_05715, partial [Chloroflexi bacterium]|nr:hypothetical protein [Chloroflexota bacterium]
MKTHWLIHSLLTVGLSLVLLALFWTGLSTADPPPSPEGRAVIGMEASKEPPTSSALTYKLLGQDDLADLPIAAAAFEGTAGGTYEQPIPFVGSSPNGLDTTVYV